MRVIYKESEDQQFQRDPNGFEYVYRKDFVSGGDMKNEYSLSLVYSRKAKDGTILKTIEPQIPIQTGDGSVDFHGRVAVHPHGSPTPI